MNELGKTVVFLAVAGALAGVAWYVQPRVSRDASDFIEDREPFFRVDPDKIKGLEITAYDPDADAVRTFSVKLEKGAWVIPSLNNYPADAAERMRKTAGAVLGLIKDSVVSNDKDSHKEYGVVDPFDSSGDPKSWGRRIKLMDEQGNVFADLVIGKEAKKAGSDGGDFKFVRIADKPRVYAVDCGNLDLSTRFSDWVKPELVADSDWNFDAMKRTEYRQNRQTGVITSDVPFELKKVDGKWRLEGLAEGQETDEDKARDYARAVSGLKIVGVRQKPQGLQGDLRTLNDKIQAQIAIDAMADRGFFSLSDGRIVSPDGDVTVETNEGIVYTLRIGGKFLGKREDVEAGKEDEKAIEESPSTPPKAEDAQRPPETQENRFLLVSVSFNENKFPPVEPPPGVEGPTQEEAPKAEDAAPEKGAAPPDEPPPAEPAEADAPKADPATLDATRSPDGIENVGFQEGESKPAEDSAPANNPTEAPTPEAAAAPPAEPAQSKEAADKVDSGSDAASGDGKALDETTKKAEEEAKRKAEEAKAKYEQEKAERDRKVENGRKKAQELQARFDLWFYVVSEEQAQKLLANRDAFIKKVEPAKKDGEQEGEAGRTEDEHPDDNPSDAAPPRPTEAAPEESKQGGSKPPEDADSTPEDEPAEAAAPE